MLVCRLAVFFGLAAACALAATLKVGPRKTYSTPCQAVAAAGDGDLILIDGSVPYRGDVCAIKRNNLVLRGVNGRPVLDAAGRSAEGKAIWVVYGNNTTVENIEFTGASVESRNGAGIRMAGRNLTVRGCYFHDNEEGILAENQVRGEILVEYTEFFNNDDNRGYAHNIYVSGGDRFTMRYSYSHDVRVANLVKSRARETRLLYNRIGNEDAGAGSWEVDIPNGGRVYMVGNTIHQNAKAKNRGLMEYGLEGLKYPDNELFVVNNTFVNDAETGVFVTLPAGPLRLDRVLISNNIFAGPGVLSNRPDELLESNNVVEAGTRSFVDAGKYDYRLRPGSAAIDAHGLEAPPPGPLVARYQYVLRSCAEPRRRVGAIDAGAFEYGADTGSANLVISQVYAGAGSAGAPYPANYVELFNRGQSSTSLDGWSLQIAAGDGMPWSVIRLKGKIPPGGYYLVGPSGKGSGRQPEADLTASYKLDPARSHIVLLSSAARLNGVLPCSDALVDQVGYGPVSFVERQPLAQPLGTRAAVRKQNGCRDTNDNAADFVLAAPAPRNAKSPLKPCARREGAGGR